MRGAGARSVSAVSPIVRCYLEEKVHVHPPAHIKDLFLAPYYGWLVEILLEAIQPDMSQGEDARGSSIRIEPWSRFN
jgi:hypothetical protein